MSRGDADPVESRESGRLDSLYAVRDRIAYALFLRKDLGKKSLFALCLGLGLLIAANGIWLNREPGPDPGWRVYLPQAPVVGMFAGLFCSWICFIAPFWGGVSFFLFLGGLVVVYTPEIMGPALLLLLVTLASWFAVRPQRGAMAALVALPYLESFLGLGALAPIGFACFYPTARAIALTTTTYLWVVAIGLVRGSIPRFNFEDRSVFEEFDWLTRTDIANPPFTAPILEANGKAFYAISEALVGKDVLLWPFLIHTALAAGVIWIVGLIYRPVRFQDRLALEYLSREGQTAGSGSLRPFSGPLGVLVGLLSLAGLQGGLTLLIPGLYSPFLLAMDCVSALILLPIVALHYHGDPTMPQEFSYHLPEPAREHSPATGSSFRIPTPSEMRLRYPAGPAPAAGASAGPVEGPSVRLKSWRDKVDLEWEGVLPDGRKLRWETGEKEQKPVPGQPIVPRPEVEAPIEFEIGKKIDGQYRIDQIHRGGMGVVFIVTDEFSEVRYAVKTLRDDLRNHPEAVARFTSEAKTWIRLGHHPNVVQAMYYREVASRPLLFLEYIDGTDLEEVFSRPGPPPPLASLVSWGIQICEGMQHAATKDFGGGMIGVVHRDIKPGNIMLTYDGVIKITDFGLAKAAEAPTNLTREKVGLGTLKYMAPEQVKDAKHVDARADIYAVGAVLYEGAVGHPPFTDEDSISLYMSVLSKEPERMRHRRPDIPEEFERIVMRCLSKDRDLRYSSFEELGWALRRLEERMKSGGDLSHLRVVQ
ncbi:MAG: Serine/threonine-protein kinase PknD [bacterium]|nr:Serine/threonine-protein kinase PknD [bacterium]